MTKTERHTPGGVLARLARVLALVLLGLGGGGTIAWAQIGQLMSPGPLSKAHATLEGASNCQKCHEPGRKVTASLCLSCHKPIAERIQLKKGIHRNVTDDCVRCHVEHGRGNAELRPFNLKTFDHARDAGFALEGRHAALGTACAKCHKTRSFLTASPTCTSCHADVHKGTLGNACQNCHPTSSAFKEAKTRFDHAKASFALTGAHQRVACEKCHVNQVYKGVKFAQCTDCHKSPHRQELGDACTSCHTNDSWRTQKFDHTKTLFPLRGKHGNLACVKCHTTPPLKAALKFDRCTACHQDPHRGTFKQDCSACHNERAFGRASFDHATGTKFPLTGKHAPLTCATCHKGVATGGRTPAQVVDFRGLSTACASCHTDVHKAGLGRACEACHTTTTFRVSTYTHPRFAEFFGGQHRTVTCAHCHIVQAPGAPRRTGVPVDGWRFKNVSTACVTCHQDVHLGQVGTACEACHTIDAAKFAPVKFAHTTSAFPLTGRHENVECRKCHKPETGTFPAGPGTAVRLKGLSTACVTCHQDIHLGQVGTACEACHTTDAAKFAPVKFAHAKSAFPLTGQHQNVECRKCHKPETGTFPAGPGTAVRLRGVPTACASCHQDRHLGQLGNRCETCHATASFKLASYKHATQSTLMIGKHTTLACDACHKPQEADYPAGHGTTIRYKVGTTCSSCHADAHRGALGKTCEACHTPAEWRTVSRAFHKTGVFPLEGRHIAVPCASCHWDGVIKGTPTRCYDCHWIRRQDDRYETRLGTDCENCHRPISWTAVNWNHGTVTGLVLSPVHQALGCDGCHKNQRFERGGVTCYSCHAERYQATKSPNHVAAGFPTQCEICHRASHVAWSQATFNHAAVFPLAGVHATQACSACHKNNVYRGTPRDCVGCHRADYDRTTSPAHAAAGFPTTCDSCHKAGDANWRTSLNHAAFFPLAGVHATQACTACHKNNVYKGTPRDCVGCHRANYDRTTSPNHVAAGFPITCESCHSASAASWNTSFNHAAFFPLVGVHATQACSACHKNNVYRGTSRDCVGCHRANYDRTTSPNHVAAGFPITCESCHSASAANWNTSFNHNAAYPLVGVHATQVCSACHKNNVYRGTPRDCVGCHRANYDRTNNPNHLAAGFPTTCEICHNAASSTWSASFDHNRFFVLAGRHINASCNSCHVNNIYRGTPRECYPCHQARYDQSTNPNHRAAGFPTTCEVCHNAADSAWSQGRFNHTWFPIASGRHAGNPCSRCHTDANNYRVFSCLSGCHPRTSMDNEHRGRPGYRYDSAACYSCHPTGRAG